MSATAIRMMETPLVSGEQIALLTKIWMQVLRTSDVTLQSNFFDLGGDSLLAITLFLEIERATGCNLPITMIYEAPTLVEQAALLQNNTAPAFSPLVLIKPGNPGAAPLFIFHGVGGTVVEFATVGKLINIPGEVYAVQAQGVDDTQQPLDRVEDMAELYYNSIRQKQPGGPYWLCGYSFGGLLAIEVARRLQAAGEQIALLFLIDAYAHPITWPRKSRMKVKLRRCARTAYGAFNRPGPVFSALKSIFAGKLQSRADVAPSAMDRLARKKLWLVNRNPDLPAPLLRTRLAADEALYRYWPRYYSGDVVFLKARRPDPDFPDDPKHVWRRLVRSLKLYVSDGSHMTIINEHAPAVAAQINACIQEAASVDGV